MNDDEPTSLDEWNNIYHAGHHPVQREQAQTTPAWEDFANWAKYLSLEHVALLGDETGTVVTVVEVQASLGNHRIGAAVVSFDLVGGEQA